MPESGSQILNYRGDANLGIGSNANIPVINANSNLDVINETARTISLLNHENNLKLYQQKINDRNATLQALAQGQVSSGDISPEDRVYYDRAKKAANDSFFKMIQNGGLNNQAAYKDYLGKVGDWNDITTHAQSRNLELNKLEQEKATQSLPEDIKAYDNHIKNEKDKGFWQPINPFQKAFNYNLDALTAKYKGMPSSSGQLETGASTGTTQTNTLSNRNGVVTNTQTTKTSPLKSARITSSKQGLETVVKPDGSLSEISYTPETHWDYPTMFQNAQEDYISDPTARQGQISWLNDVQAYPDPQKLKLLQSYNNRISEYSTERGIAPDKMNPDGTPHYPDQVNYAQDPQSGKVLIQETPSSFMAKHTLASIDGNYVQKPQPVFNKDIGAYNIQKEKAGVDALYKRSMANTASKKANAYVANLHDQMAHRKTAEEQDNFLNDIYNKNIVQQPLISGAGANKVSLSPIQVSNSLPVFTLIGKNVELLAPINPTTVHKNAAGVITGYEGGHYDPEYSLGGKTLSVKNISDNYIDFKKQAGGNWKGSMEDYIKEAVKAGLIDVKLKGANGATDKQLSLAAQRIISNQATKKGQEPVFGGNDAPPLDEQIPNDNQQ